MNAQSIFIVEDEIITARSIAKNIQKFGYQLAGIATNGVQAIEEILAVKPNLILMDILLGKDELDGITTAQRIQSQINIPVIYLTAHSDRATLDRAKITTPFGYILKPYSRKNLQISIELALHKHQQEIKVIEREELLSSILNAAQDGVIASNQTNKIVYMNPAAEKLTGWQATEASDRSTTEVLKIIDRRTQQSLDPIEEVLNRGEVIYLNEFAILINKDGKQTPIADSASPMKSDRITGAVLIFAPRRNYTVEESASEEQNLLVNTVTTQELNELSAYLIDLILHELRTPLTVILSTTESFRSYRQKWTLEKQDNNLKRIQQAVGQISRLLDDVSVWDELEKKQFALQPDWIDVVALSQEISNELESLDEQSQEIVLSSEGDRQAVYLDPYILRYILTNLLLNAIKYSVEGSTVLLQIKYESNRLILKVQNQGIGIPQIEREQIFEPLFRASNTGKIKGTGLGLAIVKQYVRLSNGEINLENNSPSNTIFTVSLPLMSQVT